MSTTYTGNSLAVESPDNAPQPGEPPVVSLQADTDGDTSANWYQAHKRFADEAAYLKSGLWLRHQEHYLYADTGSSITSNSDPITGYAQGSALISGGSSSVAVVGSGSQTMLGRAIQFNPSTGYAFFASRALAPFTLGATGTANLIFVLDMVVSFSGPTDATGTVFFGLAPSKSWASGSQPADAIGFCIPNASASSQWTATCKGTTSAVSATYNATGSFQRMRIEWFGQSTPQGIANTNTAFARFSISQPGQTNLNVVASINGQPTAGSGSHYVVQGAADSASLTINAKAGPFVAQWNLE